MLDVLYSFWSTVVQFQVRFLLTFFEIFKTVFYKSVDGLFMLSIIALDGLGHLFSSLNVVQYVDAIPPETKNVLALIGVNEASSIIVSAIIIRLTLQIIPFVRFGS